MPRLAAKDYLRTHDRLRKLWLHDLRLFAELTPTDQWQLHDFFRPDKDWSDLQLLQHRDAVTAERPSLPHQAGRALEKFWTLCVSRAVKQVRTAKAPAGSATRVRQEDRQISIKAVARPEIDVEKLARAYIYLRSGSRQEASCRAGARWSGRRSFPTVNVTPGHAGCLEGSPDGAGVTAELLADCGSGKSGGVELDGSSKLRLG